MTSPSVFIILINWNGCDDTLDCLNSLIKLSYTNFSIIVVENCSSDNSFFRLSSWSVTNQIPLLSYHYNFNDRKLRIISESDSIKEGLKQLIIVDSSENTGFCLGNNLGMQVACQNHADYILVLNNDTICDKHFLEPLVSHAENNPDIGLISSLICYEDDMDTIWWGGGEFNKWLSPKYRHQGKKKSSFHKMKPKESQWASGCATFFPIHIYEKYGGFDEIFFIWCDEWDLSMKIRKDGYKIAIEPDSIVYHKVGRSLGITSPLVFYYSFRNMLIFRRRYLTAFRYYSFLLVCIPVKFIKSILYSIKFLEIKFLIGFFDAFWDGLNLKGGIWKRQEI